MKSFMNALYQDGEGKDVTGVYCNQPFYGQIKSIHCASAGGLNVYVELDDPIVVANDLRTTLVLGGTELFEGNGTLTRNLHVYL